MLKPFAFVIATVLFVTACGGGSDPSQWDTNDPEQFCRGAAEYACTLHFECIEEENRRFASMLACQQAFEADCEDYLEADPSKTYSPTNAATCLEDMSTRGCLDVDEPWLDAACDDITVTRQGKLKFTWTGDLCVTYPGVRIVVEVSGNGQDNYTFPSATCAARQTVEGPAIPFGIYAHAVYYYFSDGSGPYIDYGSVELDADITIVAL
jgi:hypothetical protein